MSVHGKTCSKAQLHEAGGEAYVDLCRGAERARDTNCSGAGRPDVERLSGGQPRTSQDSELAQLMLRAYSAKKGSTKPSEEVQVLQIVVAAKPTNVAYYAQLARYAYLAQQHPRRRSGGGEGGEPGAGSAEQTRLKTELAALREERQRRTDLHDHHERQGLQNPQIAERRLHRRRRPHAAPGDQHLHRHDDHEANSSLAMAPSRGGSPPSERQPRRGPPGYTARLLIGCARTARGSSRRFPASCSSAART